MEGSFQQSGQRRTEDKGEGGVVGREWLFSSYALGSDGEGRKGERERRERKRICRCLYRIKGWVGTERGWVFTYFMYVVPAHIWRKRGRRVGVAYGA